MSEAPHVRAAEIARGMAVKRRNAITAVVTGGTLVNRGLIAGAAGGAGGMNPQSGASNPAGMAGAGVYAGPDGAATVINSGTIVGPVDSVL